MNISGYTSAGETYRSSRRGGHHVVSTDEGIEREPEEDLEVIEDPQDRESKTPDAADIITTWQAANEALVRALLDLDAPIPRSKAIAACIFL